MSGSAEYIKYRAVHSPGRKCANVAMAAVRYVLTRGGNRQQADYVSRMIVQRVDARGELAIGMQAARRKAQRREQMQTDARERQN